uniref:Uncharacterized protein n=1 Tax=Panagrolaimus davidi TaxID=227884 RepID=A0A914PXQ5_9BILA
MVVGAYLISGAHMRIKDEKNGVRFIGLPNGAPPIPGRLTPSTMKERAELVFQLSPKKMKNLVIVNSALSTFKMIQACVEAGEKYADNIIVIPPLLAILTYSLEDLSKFQNPPTKEVLLVVTITPRFVDFITLRRDQNFKLYVAEFEHFEDLNQGKSSFSKIYNYCYPHATIFVVHDSMVNIANEIRIQFNPDNCFIKAFKKWDFILLTGGHLYSMEDEDGFDSRYHIANFSSGYETSIQNDKTLIYERHILLPNRSALPCTIYGFDGVGQQINVYYSPQYYQRSDGLVAMKRPALKRPIFASGKAQEVLGYIDERGVPYAKDSAGYNNLKKLAQISKSENQVDPEPFQNPSTSKTIVDESIHSKKPHQTDPTFVTPPSTSHSKMFVQSHLSSINGSNGRSQIKFLFNENFYAIEILSPGFSKMLNDAFGNEWNPLYLSMAQATVEVGEKAKIHNERFPEYVVYDVLKNIGKPLNEIKIDPKWGFKLVEKDGIIYFQIETISGPRLFPQEMIIAAFLKSMKLQTESILNIQIKEIRISTNFKLNESQKTIFEKAAEMNFLGISGFDVL